MNEKISQLINELEALSHQHLEIGNKIGMASGTRMYPLDFMAYAALKRSLSLISGFCQMIKTGNYLCASSLIRLQVDTLIRIFAPTLFENPHEFVLDMLNGKPINKMEYKKRKLTDSLLVDLLSKHIPYIKEVYDKTCGFIHFSERHLFSLSDTTENKLKIKISSTDLSIPDDIIYESIQIFKLVTIQILNILNQWAFTKANPELSNLLKSVVDKPRE